MANIDITLGEKGTFSSVHDTVRMESQPNVETELSSDPPDGGQGWVIVIAILFLNAVTWGMYSPGSGFETY